MKRALIAIGVHDVRGMTKLPAVLDGVNRVESWALAQGMERALVRKIDDSSSVVKVDQIEDTVFEVLEDDSLEQLIIYFAGHGFNSKLSEYWLMSQGAERSSQSVNLAGSITLARSCPIPHVAFFSDACRSAPETLSQQAITGTVVFPPPTAGSGSSKVDVFYATRIGDPALEIKDTSLAASKFRAAYTESFLEAVNGLHQDICDDDTDLGQKVVRPWALHDFLMENVPERVFQMTNSFEVSQVPDSIITSREGTVWISDVSKADATVQPAFNATPESAAASIPVREQLASASGFVRAAIQREELELAAAISEVRSAAVQRESLPGVVDLAAQVAFNSEEVAPAFGTDHFETGCGFQVRGDEFADVVTGGNAGEETAEIMPERDAVRVLADNQPRSVLLEFASGFGTLLPAFPGFVCSLTISSGRLIDVNYEPSRYTDRWEMFEQRHSEIRTLRSVTSSASRNGMFRLDGEDAEIMARRMQLAKGVDPSLAMYAAHAYHQLGNKAYLHEMADFLMNDLNAIPLDIAILAGRIYSAATADADHVVPFLPVLAQTWPLLPAYSIILPQGLEEIEQHLVFDSLWTLFKPAGVEMIRHAINSGVVR